MTTKTQPVHIDTKTHAALKAKAKSEGKTIAVVVAEAVADATAFGLLPKVGDIRTAELVQYALNRKAALARHRASSRGKS